jgi:outer membrane protein insertion porin family
MPRRKWHRPWTATLVVVALWVVACGATPAPAPPPPTSDADLVPTELKTVVRVKLEGRRHVPAREIWAMLKTRRPSFWPWRERPRLRLDFLRADTSAIASVCRQHGYLDARAHWRILPSGKPDLAEVRFVIEEGRQSHIRDVRLLGVNVVSSDALRRKLYARRGRPFNPAYLVGDTVRIVRYYQEKGYLPRVASAYTRDSLEVTVKYTVAEGHRFVFGETYLSSPGDLKVSTHLIRRELLMRKGEPFQISRVERSIDRLYSTGLFSQAQITMLPDSSRRTVEFDLRVRERKRRWIDAGVGSGSTDRINFTGEWGNGNLTGHGQQGVLSSIVALDGQWRFHRWRPQISLLEPWLFRTRTNGQLTGYYEQFTDRSVPQWVIDQIARGVTLQLRRELDRYTALTLTQDNAFVTQDVTFLDPRLDVTRADSLKAATPSSYTTHRLQLGLLRDSRDTPLAPTRGTTTNVTAQVAGGPLKGTSSFTKLEGLASWYAPTSNGWVFAVRGRGGVIDPFGTQKSFTPDTTVDGRVARVPLEDRFRIGGVNSIRGYSESSIPTSGGLAMLEADVEMRVPLIGPLGIEVFADAGNVWARPSRIRLSQFLPEISHRSLGEDDVRYVFGVGPRINFPIGPLRLDFTWSLRPSPTGPALVAAPQFAIGPSF